MCEDWCEEEIRSKSDDTQPGGSCPRGCTLDRAGTVSMLAVTIPYKRIPRYPFQGIFQRFRALKARAWLEKWSFDKYEQVEKKCSKLKTR